MKTQQAPQSLANGLKELKAYSAPITARSLAQLSVTAIGFIVSCVAMYVSLRWTYAATLLLSIPAAGFLVRLFMIQHDCGHHSFFKRTWMNDLVGRIIGVLTMTPYGYWRAQHAKHHATAGNLDKRGVGDVTTLTVDEFIVLPRWRRWAYRAYRNPLILFGLGPTFVFLLKHRAPFDLPLRRTRMWLSVLGTNAGIALGFTAAAAAMGLGTAIKLYLPVMMIASSIGIWLFYVQHQFEGVYWRRQGNWRHADAALLGSSYYALPRPLQWMTANIGFHHIHHLSSRIPNYRLEEAMKHAPVLRENGISLARSFRCARLSLWDECQGKMIGFRDLAPSPRHLRMTHLTRD
jgi:omega-6 fatty acid desaturase (delta-12 desaturase)